jgi:hypothetical protein
MAEVPGQINLDGREILYVLELSAISPTSKAAVGRKLPRSFADSIAADWVHPDSLRGVDTINKLD